MRNRFYQYTESGLDTVFLKSGFEYQNSPGGRTVIIHNIDGLHKAIGTALVCEPKRLTGKEFRFLRTELLLSQANLAKILGVKELTVGRWEKGETEIPLTAEMIVRLLFAEGNGMKKSRVRELLEKIADIDDEMDRHLTLQQAKRGEWTTTTTSEAA